jgi:hypothetical protein
MQQDLAECVNDWRFIGRCEFDDGVGACSAYCVLNGITMAECVDYWDANGWCPPGDPPPPPTCGDAACLFCPVEALDPTVGALFPDGLIVPIPFTAVASGRAGTTLTVDVSATSMVGPLPINVTATVSDESGTIYSATTGAAGAFPIAVPAQEVSGTTLSFDAGEGSGTVEVEDGATEVTIKMSAAVFDLLITDPIELPMRLDAGLDGPCQMLGDGVRISAVP